VINSLLLFLILRYGYDFLDLVLDGFLLFFLPFFRVIFVVNIQSIDCILTKGDQIFQ
jgi:hypothetical protein